MRGYLRRRWRSLAMTLAIILVIVATGQELPVWAYMLFGFITAALVPDEEVR